MKELEGQANKIVAALTARPELLSVVLLKLLKGNQLRIAGPWEPAEGSVLVRKDVVRRSEVARVFQLSDGRMFYSTAPEWKPTRGHEPTMAAAKDKAEKALEALGYSLIRLEDA